MKKYIFSAILLIFSQLVFAQNQKVSLQLQHILFDNFVDTVETIIPVKIYYSNTWTDSLFIDVDSENLEFSNILDNSLKNSGFTFFVTHDQQLIIIKGQQIKDNFDSEYKQWFQNIESTDIEVVYNLNETKDTETIDANQEYKVFKLGYSSEMNKGKKAMVSGLVNDAITGLPLVGVAVFNQKLKIGCVTANNGSYSLELPKGQNQLEFRLIGMRTTRRNVMLFSDGTLNVQMYEQRNEIEEVTVSAGKESNVLRVDMGLEKISARMMKQLPMSMGEADVIKSTLLLPGVQTVGEASGGYNVRGGSNDQNLILLDGAPMINSSHFFGFFAAFNSDLIKNVDLYKSSIPLKYGGRISSVMDIELVEGNHQRMKTSGGINPLSGRLMVEGPVGKKLTYAISSRATYSDWILKMLPSKQLQNSSASFYDLQGIVHLKVSETDHFSLSGYVSNDKFNFYRQSAYNYNNAAATLKWKHQFSTQLLSEFSAIMSNYGYELDNIQTTTSFSSVAYKLKQNILKADFNYFYFENHTLNFGTDFHLYGLKPGKQIPLSSLSEITPKELDEEKAAHLSLYISDEYDLSPSITVSGGLRYNFYQNFAQGSEFLYKANQSRSLASILDTVFYKQWKPSAFYHAPELRLSARWQMGMNSSLKFGVQRMYQYIHLISNTMSVSPTDTWKLSDKYVLPQRGDQISVGYYQNFMNNKIETSFETYFKRLANIIDYKGGANLVMNEHIETDILNGEGKAYGLEFMVKKTQGWFSGWVSYTYSRIFHRVQSSFSEETINNGNYFKANYDKPHDLKIVSYIKLSRRFNFTTNFVYNTGRPITYPVAFYSFMNTNRVYYSNRNEYRIPDYIRLDFAATLNGNLHRQKLNHSSFTLAVYNVLGKRNPYSVYFKSENGEVKGYQMSIFGKPIVTLTYNFKILGNAADDY